MLKRFNQKIAAYLAEMQPKTIFRPFTLHFRPFFRRDALAISPMNQGSDHFSGPRTPLRNGENGEARDCCVIPA
jgi:hypothetical protein